MNVRSVAADIATENSLPDRNLADSLGAHPRGIRVAGRERGDHRLGLPIELAGSDVAAREARLLVESRHPRHPLGLTVESRRDAGSAPSGLADHHRHAERLRYPRTRRADAGGCLNL